MTTSPEPLRLREALAGAAPRDFKLKVAWRAVIQANRLRKRRTGVRGHLSGQGPVQQALDQPVRAAGQEALGDLKRALRRLVRDPLDEPGRVALAAEIDARVAALVGVEVEDEVQVEVTGWPPGTPARHRRRVAGPAGVAPAALPARAAAALARRLDGLVLAGHPLTVRVALGPGERLPPPPRAERFDRSRWSRPRPWLPHLDEEGRYSLTPEPIARRQAARFVGIGTVLDACCGCGGNAVALAQAGRSVVAVEPDAGRLALAEQNARALGVADRIRFVRGRAEGVVPDLQGPGVGLFLDPPWGGPGATLEGLTRWLTERAALLRVGPVALKLPRAFPVDALPERPGGWRVHLELGEPGGPDGAVVRMWTATAGLRPAPGRGDTR